MNNQHIHAVLNNKVPCINEELSHINHGGCGWSALALHNALKGHGIDSAIVLIAICGYDIDDVDDLIKKTGTDDINSAYQHLFRDMHKYDSSLGGTLNGHMCIKFDGKLYDSDGEYDGKAISEHITPKTMAMFLGIDDCWNATFKNANRHNDDILVTFESFFNNLFSEHLTQ